MQGPNQVPLVVNDQKLVFQRFLQNLSRCCRHLILTDCRRSFCHHVVDLNGTDIAAFFNQTSQIALGKDTCDAVFVVDNGSHADVLFGDFAHRIQDARPFRHA